MAKFLTPLICEKVEGTKDTWELHEALQYDCDLTDCTITIPKGYKTDFASVPWGFWNLFPKSGEYDAAAVVHDYLYGTHDFTRHMADDIFLEAMTALGVPGWKRRTMWLAVRGFGWLSFKK